MPASAATRALTRLRTVAAGHPVAADAVLALVVYGLLTLGITSAAEVEHEGGRTLGALLGVPIVAPLAWRRRRALVVLAVAAAAAAAVALTFGPIGAEVAVLIALATVAARAPREQAVPAAALVAAAALILTWAIAEDRLPALVATSAAVAAAVAVGVAARARRAELLALADRAERLERERAQEAELAVAAERARIARELHDVIAHNVAVMVALADGAQHALDERPDQARTAMEHVAGTGREALTELRGVLGLLRDGDEGAARRGSGTAAGDPGPGRGGAHRAGSRAGNGRGGSDAGQAGSGTRGRASGADADLGAAAPGRVRAPQPGLDDLDELVDRVRAAGLKARLRVEGEPSPLSPLTQVTLYRIVQEALTNVLRHATGATSVDVRLTWTAGGVDVRVTDDGRAAGASAAAGSGVPAGSSAAAGRGLAGMRERAAVHGAELRAGPQPSGGWLVSTRLPVVRP